MTLCTTYYNGFHEMSTKFDNQCKYKNLSGSYCLPLSCNLASTHFYKEGPRFDYIKSIRQKTPLDFS